MTFFSLVSEIYTRKNKLKFLNLVLFLLEKKNQELEETQRLKKSKRYQKEMLFYLNPQKNLKNLLI